MKKIQQVFDFIDESPTAFQAVENIEKTLEEKGFERLYEEKSWELLSGKSYYVTRNDSSVIAFSLPQKEWKGFHIVAAHCDSPAFKIKENAEMSVENAYVKLNTEKYGGMILSTWLDRPLSVAGRIFTDGIEGIQSHRVNVKEDLLVIPNLAIHMQRELNNGYVYNPQKDMLPVFSSIEGKGELLTLVAKNAGVSKESILSHDLYLYVREKGHTVGLNGEWIMSPRLDDLQCVYGAVESIKEAEPKEYIAVSAIFDNEEVGSDTRQGAGSTFLRDVLEKIVCTIKGTSKGLQEYLSNSFLISADNAHALHPNHTEKADPTNRPVLNGGIVIKHHAQQKYTTDAYSAACIKKYCKEIGIACQDFYNRSDMTGGSTLGNISITQAAIPSVDIGLPQWAMHSAVETAGRKDTEDFIRLCSYFFAG